jgi:hypothetical protein
VAIKKKPPKDTRPQSERFIEAARNSGADESGKAFERVFKKLIAKQQKIAKR